MPAKKKGEPPNKTRTGRTANLKDGNRGKKGEPPNQKRTRNRAAKVAAKKKSDSLTRAEEAELKRYKEKRKKKK